MAAAHRSALPVSGPYGHPFHPLLATVPIGAWVCTVAFDAASKLSDGRPYARAATWLCAIGIASAVVAAVAGLIDSLRITKGTEAHRTMSAHRLLMIVTLVLFVVSFILRRSDSASADYLLDGTPTAAMVLAIVGLVFLVVGGWFGGRLVFTHGVRVTDEADQIAGHRQVTSKTVTTSDLQSPDPNPDDDSNAERVAHRRTGESTS